MRHRRVADLMTPDAVAVRPGTTFKEIARLLDEFGISAVPVVDVDGRPMGVVSEADLVRRQASGGGAPTAQGLMTSPAVVARPEWSVVKAARVMDRNRIKRLPVTDDAGRVIGVLSRSDLIQLFLRRDRAIQEEILEDVLTRTLRLSPSALSVEVTDGRVTLSGTVPRRSLVPVTVRLCESVDGVVDVTDRLTFTWDDTLSTSHEPTAAAGEAPHGAR
ncbi:CBS domain-containing protein [Streptomyces wuyuanensis]|uniref:CBS domain-containing protein n=1 Tax=Streptomyces wuyuanensis TaxID=1196353 RepID=A0A1G9YID7_9ACTN|nr:CBS domain-containing protein [Streptomyces wuyuanensis]SDN08265.1 CBS domain-containing protein [Streptomyces wuyuanensis]